MPPRPATRRPCEASGVTKAYAWTADRMPDLGFLVSHAGARILRASC